MIVVVVVQVKIRVKIQFCNCSIVSNLIDDDVVDVVDVAVVVVVVVVVERTFAFVWNNLQGKNIVVHYLVEEEPLTFGKKG